MHEFEKNSTNTGFPDAIRLWASASLATELSPGRRTSIAAIATIAAIAYTGICLRLPLIGRSMISNTMMPGIVMNAEYWLKSSINVVPYGVVPSRAKTAGSIIGTKS